MLPWFESFAKQLSTRVAQKRLHHALLLSGAKGIGKHQLADDIACLVLCKTLTAGEDACGQCQSCQLFAAGSHPDFQYVTTEKTQIGVDAIRMAIQALHSRAQLNHNKVLVIAEADLMSESAANALLKTLEEPTESTYIILVTDSVGQLLPTILSRCEKHALATPDPNVSLIWLDETLNTSNHENHVTADLLAAYSHAPMAVLDFYKRENAKTHEEFIANVAQLNEGKLDAQIVAAQWQDELNQVLKWAQLYIAEKAKLSAGLISSSIWQQYTECSELAIKARHAGVNKVLLLTQLFLLLSKVE